MRYNNAHGRTRCANESLNGELKRRFACLNYLRVEPQASSITLACIVLHNIATQCSVPLCDIADPPEPLAPADDPGPHVRCLMRWLRDWVVVQCEMLLSTITFEVWSQMMGLCLFCWKYFCLIKFTFVIDIIFAEIILWAQTHCLVEYTVLRGMQEATANVTKIYKNVPTKAANYVLFQFTNFVILFILKYIF